MDICCNLHRFLLSGHKASFPEAKRPVRKADHSPRLVQWSYTSTPPTCLYAVHKDNFANANGTTFVTNPTPLHRSARDCRHCKNTWQWGTSSDGTPNLCTARYFVQPTSLRQSTQPTVSWSSTLSDARPKTRESWGRTTGSRQGK
jgi:hypothetical protein